MKISNIVLTLCLILCASRMSAAAPYSTRVVSEGATRLGATIGSHQVVINIWTHKIDTGKMERPEIPHTSCTYSRELCVLVDAVQFIVDKNAIFVPRSAFCDLSDLIKIELDMIGGHLVLTVFGGDASEAYEAKIEFDTGKVTRRVMASAMDVDQPTEITTYYETSLPN
jgi:hypothetical protein